VLLLHEVHRVAGAKEEEFESLYRDELLPALAKTAGSRLLWFLRVAHGSGPAYTIVTITGCKDASDWSELAERIRHGDLAEWSAEADAIRHACEAKILAPVSWSPLQDIDFDAVPTTGAAHDLSLFMEDTAWPYAGGLSSYLAKAGTLYADQTLANQKREGRGIIELEAAFQPVWGSHRTNEVVLWQRIVNHKALLWMFANDLPPSATAPGTWMHDALAVRDRWESRLLRSAAWSPLY
jgi:hypothetical protein